MCAASWRRIEDAGTTGTVRRPDRVLAAQLYHAGSVEGYRKRIGVAATRRLMRPSQVPPLDKIRSLAYFLPVIEEVLALHVSPDYFRYLRHKLERTRGPGSFARSIPRHKCASGADDENQPARLRRG